MPNPTGTLSQQNSQELFLRSLNDAASSEGHPLALVGLIAITVLSLFLVAYIQHRRNRKPAAPSRKFVRNPQKLLKELAAALDMSSADVRKLEHHAKTAGVENPLTLLLCPSLVKKPDEQ